MWGGGLAFQIKQLKIWELKIPQAHWLQKLFNVYCPNSIFSFNVAVTDTVEFVRGRCTYTERRGAAAADCWSRAPRGNQQNCRCQKSLIKWRILCDFDSEMPCLLDLYSAFLPVEHPKQLTIHNKAHKFKVHKTITYLRNTVLKAKQQL